MEVTRSPALAEDTTLVHHNLVRGLRIQSMSRPIKGSVTASVKISFIADTPFGEKSRQIWITSAAGTLELLGTTYWMH